MLKRRIVLVGPAVALVAVIVPTLLLADRLPDPIAGHWSLSGEADGSSRLAVLTGGVAAAVVAGWGVLLRHARVRAALRLTIAPWIWAGAAFAAALQLTTVLANLDAGSWRSAELKPWAVLPSLLAGVAAGFAAHALERARPVAVETVPPGRASVGLHAGERAVWSARVRGAWALIAAGALGAGFTLSAVLTGLWWLAAAGWVVALAVATVSEIVATVDERGLTIAYGPLGWPRQTVPLSEIATAEAIDIDPWRVGGWGVRKVPRRAGATAVVIRAGEGIRVHRRDGRDLLVTIPDAARAAGLLNDLSLRRAA